MVRSATIVCAMTKGPAPRQTAVNCRVVAGRAVDRRTGAAVGRAAAAAGRTQKRSAAGQHEAG